MQPLHILDVHRRGKIFLIFAWLGSVLCSLPQVRKSQFRVTIAKARESGVHLALHLPQMLVFHLETHPIYTCFTQCITFNTFSSYVHELLYSLFVMMTMFWFPLIVIFFTYISIFMEISRRSQEGTVAVKTLERVRKFISNLHYVLSCRENESVCRRAVRRSSVKQGRPTY